MSTGDVFTCPNCATNFPYVAALAGKRVKCPACGQSFVAQSAQKEPAEEPPVAQASTPPPPPPPKIASDKAADSAPDPRKSPFPPGEECITTATTISRAQRRRRPAGWIWVLGAIVTAVLLVFSVIALQREDGDAAESAARSQIGPDDTDQGARDVKWEWDQKREAERAVNWDAMRAVKWGVEKEMKGNAEFEARLAVSLEEDQDSNDEEGQLEEWTEGDMDWYAEEQHQRARWQLIEELVSEGIFWAVEVHQYGATAVVGRQFYALTDEKQEQYARLVWDYTIVKLRWEFARVSLIDSRSGGNAGAYRFGELSMELGRWKGPSAEDWPLEFLSVQVRPRDARESASRVDYEWTMKVKNHYYKPVSAMPRILLLDKDGFILAELLSNSIEVPDGEPTEFKGDWLVERLAVEHATHAAAKVWFLGTHIPDRERPSSAKKSL